MSKFITKHGCCIHPVENISSTTCQVFSNPEFDKVAQSDPFCGMGKSSPDFNQNRKIISWGYLDFTPDDKQNGSQNKEVVTILKGIHKKPSTESINYSFITLYGKNKPETKNRVDQIQDLDTVSEASIYRPIALKTSKNRLSRTEKVLDYLSMCLWKCSAWCQ